MHALFKLLGVLMLVSVVGCGITPKKTTAAASGPTVAAQQNTGTPCPWYDPNAIIKYGYPDRWREMYHEPPTVYVYYTCSGMRPLVEWAKTASRHESEYGRCSGSHTSFVCESTRGPSGTSRRGSRWEARGDQLSLGLTAATLKTCSDAASERRHLYVSVDRDGQMRYTTRSECYW